MKTPALQETIVAHLRGAGAPRSSRDLAQRFLLIRHDDEATCHRLLAPLLADHPSIRHDPDTGWSFRPGAGGRSAPPAAPARPAAAGSPVTIPTTAIGRTALRDFVALAADGGGPGGSGVPLAVSIVPVVAEEECREEHLTAGHPDRDDLPAVDPPGIDPPEFDSLTLDHDAPPPAMSARRGGVPPGLDAPSLRTLAETVGDLPIVCHRVAREVRPLVQASALAGIPFHPLVISVAKLGHLLLGIKANHTAFDLATALEVDTRQTDDCRGRSRLVARSFLKLIPMLEKIGLNSFEALQEYQDLPADRLDFSRFGFTADDLKELPGAPGIYRFLDRSGTILYIGKAGNLKQRVASYFIPSARGTEKGRAILDQVHRFTIETVASELEAILVEAALISEHRPRLNRQFDVHERTTPYGPRLNLAVVLPDHAAGGSETPACTVHLMRAGHYLRRIRGVAPPDGTTAPEPDRWVELRQAMQRLYFRRPDDDESDPADQAGTAVDWQLIATYLRRHRARVNLLDVDECGSPGEALARIRVLVAGAAEGAHLVTR